MKKRRLRMVLSWIWKAWKALRAQIKSLLICFMKIFLSWPSLCLLKAIEFRPLPGSSVGLLRFFVGSVGKNWWQG